jgi:putative addiction module killer protein
MLIVRETEEFRSWLDALHDKRAQVRIASRLRYAEAGNLGDWGPIQGDVSEMRIDYGPGYRLYFTRRGKVFIAMLCGGTKSTQKRDTRRAVAISAEIGEDI